MGALGTFSCCSLHVSRICTRSIQKKGMLLILSPGSGVTHATRAYDHAKQIWPEDWPGQSISRVSTGLYRAIPAGGVERQAQAPQSLRLSLHPPLRGLQACTLLTPAEGLLPPMEGFLEGVHGLKNSSSWDS